VSNIQKSIFLLSYNDISRLLSQEILTWQGGFMSNYFNGLNTNAISHSGSFNLAALCNSARQDVTIFIANNTIFAL